MVGGHSWWPWLVATNVEATKDIVNTLRAHLGTKALEGLSLDVSAREDVIVSTEAFANMVNLRLLKINSVHFSTGCYEKFSKELRWLCWHRCPLKVLPPNLDLDNLAVLDMRFSNVKKVWKETKILHRLKILDLSYSVYLVKTPKFSGLPNLERIEFEGCTSLTKVHQSIGLLERLVLLNLAKCNNLKELPDSIYNLRFLETLNLSGCSKLNRLSEHLGRLEALRKLFADRLVSPRRAASSTLLPATFSHLSSLQCLNLSNQNLSDCDMSIDFGSFPFLYHLDLTGNKFYSLPPGISNHSRLLCLCLHDCTNPPSIHELRHCTNLLSIQEICPCLGLHTPRTSIDRCQNQFDLGRSISSITITNDVPNWFDNKETGTSLLFHMPSTSINERRAMIVCIVYCVNEERNGSNYDSLTICYRNKSKGYETFGRHDDHRMSDMIVGRDHIWVTYQESFIFEEIKADAGDEIEVSTEVHGRILVKKCGIHLPVDSYYGNKEIGA
ncbi:hypothetical protein DITRI_Ditri17bG0032600 [Diplodiscus trichospermus]